MSHCPELPSESSRTTPLLCDGLSDHARSVRWAVHFTSDHIEGADMKLRAVPKRFPRAM